jgi:hypothetical protein
MIGSGESAMARVVIQTGFRQSRTARILSMTLWVSLVVVLVVSVIAGFSQLSNI